MYAFIVRPFGVKRDVDFDKVDSELITPALAEVGIRAITTEDITRAGNIREDMFEQLVVADVVVADISIHNANVFYELGIRHALRDKATFLIRANLDEVPFDLRTDRYLRYDAASPRDSKQALVDGLRETLRDKKRDSPVFDLLPQLSPVDPARFLVVPLEFREEVERAALERSPGDLSLLASEARVLPWGLEGLRLVGRKQMELKDYRYARDSWENIRKELPQDVEANQCLGTIYQKLGDLVSSDQAIQRLLPGAELSSRTRAEIYALLGSNAKSHWVQEWRELEPPRRQDVALCSAHLRKAHEEYRKGFEADLNHYYSGLNALALETVRIELASARPDVWSGGFDTPEEAERELSQARTSILELAAAIRLSLNASRERLRIEGREDAWLEVNLAEIFLLTGKNTASRKYQEALAALSPFNVDTVRRQLDIYGELGVLKECVDKVLAVFPSPNELKEEPKTVLVFTGHRVDDPDRKTPRFPPDKEGVAREAIKKEVERVLASATGKVMAFSGGASGGDLLFLEVCEELKLERHLLLIIPRDEFRRESVLSSGGNWGERFQHQVQTAEQVREYQRSAELPSWLQERKDYDKWQRGNLWILHNALHQEGTRMQLIALWNGEDGDGPGGTKHMLEQARSMGAEVVILDTKALFGLEVAPADESG